MPLSIFNSVFRYLSLKNDMVFEQFAQSFILRAPELYLSFVKNETSHPMNLHFFEEYFLQRKFVISFTEIRDLSEVSCMSVTNCCKEIGVERCPFMISLIIR